jgi:hypothetical protein
MTLDQDTWRFINTFAPWFSAFGTLSAVSVSLYLANRRERFKVSAELRMGQRDDIVLSATSVGHKDGKVSSVYMRSFGYAQAITWIVKKSRLLEDTLEYGETITLECPINTLSPDRHEPFFFLFGKPSLKLLWLRCAAMRIGVVSSTGKRFSCRLGDRKDRLRIYKRLAEELRQGYEFK